ncbi:hypothetical protein GUJ93_ZPchr0008g13332 [Zizania palustris]|uniref:Uncharacterized protein n=1 Tax=Zizania palustris TaxID=103762 RepID=A0A8J5RV81_ZIZPA|nr:hypothetical protein GUJ93_ZPchr0008g13332 [Zizania palustris]
MAGTLYRPRVKSFWALVSRLLCRHKNYRTDCAAAAAEEDDGEKSSLLTIRTSLEALLVTDGADDDDVVDATAVVCRSASRCVKKDGQLIKAAIRLSPGLPRPVVARPADCSVTTSSSGGDRDGAAAVQYRRFMFGGFRRRLLMGRSWRPMLVAIPE